MEALVITGSELRKIDTTRYLSSNGLRNIIEIKDALFLTHNIMSGVYLNVSLKLRRVSENSTRDKRNDYSLSNIKSFGSKVHEVTMLRGGIVKKYERLALDIWDIIQNGDKGKVIWVGLQDEDAHEKGYGETFAYQLEGIEYTRKECKFEF